MIRHVCFVRPYQDTALKIDSSDEEEAVNDTGSAMKPREQRCQSDLQCSVKMYLKFLSLDACSSLYCTFLSAFSVVNPLEYYRTVYIVQVLDHGWSVITPHQQAFFAIASVSCFNASTVLSLTSLIALCRAGSLIHPGTQTRTDTLNCACFFD
jgi:hypothetical protein